MTPAPLNDFELSILRRFHVGEPLRDVEIDLLCARAIGRTDTQIQIEDEPDRNGDDIEYLTNDGAEEWSCTIVDLWPVVESLSEREFDDFWNQVRIYSQQYERLQAVKSEIIKLAYPAKEYL